MNYQVIRKLSADYIFPIASEPIENGVVIVDENGVIEDILGKNDGLEEVERYNGIICPGFVNTHCHLELSHLKGKIPEKTGLVNFIIGLNESRMASPALPWKSGTSEEEKQEAIIRAEYEMLANGIVAVGDISNENVSFGQKTKNRIKYYNFIEVMGFHPSVADVNFDKARNLYDELTVKYKLQGSVTPHAPYSASEKLFQKISGFASEGDILSIHNQESAGENIFFNTGAGELLRHFKYYELDISFWKPTGRNSLQWSLKHLPMKDYPTKTQSTQRKNLKGIKTLLVHNTYTGAEDIEWAENYSDKLYWCFCPNANLYIENKNPDYDLFIGAGVRITIGTDSLASNWSLSVLDEMKTISKHAPHISLEKLLCWATKNGAEFFGFDEELGTLEKGKRPGINLIENLNHQTRQAGTSKLGVPTCLVSTFPYSLTENSSVRRLV